MFTMAPVCCIPRGIVSCSTPEILDTITAVPVKCSNPLCWVSGLVHPGCFYKWEDQLVSFLVRGEWNGTNTDQQVRNSLWTKEMWDFPFPNSLLGCNCGNGTLKRRYEDEVYFLDSGSGPVVNKPQEVATVELKKENDSSANEEKEGNWELVCKKKNKKTVKHKERNVKKVGEADFSKINSLIKPKPVPARLQEYSYHQEGQAEGKRDSNDLIHCCSCKTIHSSLIDFIEHCKSVKHRKLLGTKDDSRQDFAKVEKENKWQRENGMNFGIEVDQLKRCVLELKRQSLEQDKLITNKYEDIKKNLQLDLLKISSKEPFFIQKFQEIEEIVFELNKEFSTCCSEVDNNEKDLDICFNFIQEVTDKMNILTKEVNAAQSKISTVLSELNIEVKEVHELKVKVSEMMDKINEIKENGVNYNIPSVDIKRTEIVIQEADYSSYFVNIVILLTIMFLVLLFWLNYV